MSGNKSACKYVCSRLTGNTLSDEHIDAADSARPGDVCQQFLIIRERHGFFHIYFGGELIYSLLQGIVHIMIRTSRGKAQRCEYSQQYRQQQGRTSPYIAAHQLICLKMMLVTIPLAFLSTDPTNVPDGLM